MSRFLKMTVAADVTITAEARVEVSVASVKALAAKEEVQAVAVSEAEAKEAAVSDQELQHPEKADLAEEVKPEVPQHQSVKADFHPSVHLEDRTRQDQLMPQKKEGQERANT